MTGDKRKRPFAISADGLFAYLFEHEFVPLFEFKLNLDIIPAVRLNGAVTTVYHRHHGR